MQILSFNKYKKAIITFLSLSLILLTVITIIFLSLSLCGKKPLWYVDSFLVCDIEIYEGYSYYNEDELLCTLTKEEKETASKLLKNITVGNKLKLSSWEKTMTNNNLYPIKIVIKLISGQRITAYNAGVYPCAPEDAAGCIKIGNSFYEYCDENREIAEQVYAMCGIEF